MSAMKMDGFDGCIMGIVSRCGMEPIIAYDYAKVVEKLMQDGMTEEEAVEFHEFNQLGAWAGEGTPCFLHAMPPEEVLELLEEE